MIRKVVIKKQDKVVHDEIVVVKSEIELEKELIDIKKRYLLRHPDDYGSIHLNLAKIENGTDDATSPNMWYSTSSI